ncbi:hypothetical protein ACFQ6Q_00720 [Streptomyces sp. NPDC056437]|uniref:hypothetical protein n=1 Tax=Streptomyces sp. NPDC056437 TaxID=3345816 RepID=UPI0036B87E81
MSQLPDRLPTIVGQPHPIVQPAEVELYGERRVAYVQSMENPNQSVAIDARLLQPPAVYQPRDLTPQPLIDPLAQRLLAGGVGGGALAAGVGYGFGQAVGALAAGGPVLLLAILAALVTAGRGGSRQGDTYNITNNNRLWGKTTNNL